MHCTHSINIYWNNQWNSKPELLHVYCSLPYLGDLFSYRSLPSCEVSLCTSQAPRSHSNHFPQMNYHHHSQHLWKFCSPSRPFPSLILFTNAKITWFLQPSKILMFFKVIMSMAFIQILSLMHSSIVCLLFTTGWCHLFPNPWHLPYVDGTSSFISSPVISPEHQHLMFYKLLKMFKS